MIIDDADHFGLAQLYQLRGRVGRSDKRAYCYLLIPGENAITEDARERLQVIQQYSELGSGFNIASHDLEIRGAGEILGKEQSGQISAIGMDLYFELLEENIQQLKGNAKKVEIEPEINLKVPAYFPESYLPDISERISLYRRLSSSDSLEEIGQIGEEIQDRFGNMPVEVSNLVSLMRLKHYLKKLHVIRMSTGPKRTSLQFAETTPVKPELLIYFIQKHKNYSLTPDQKLVFDTQEGDISQLIQHLMRIALDLGVE
jgi:transcription-repair coupling factor (superfamily II helicase)